MLIRINGIAKNSKYEAQMDKCAHPQCENQRADKLIFIPSRWGWDAKFYCHEHKKYGRELSDKLYRELVDLQERLYGKKGTLVFHDVITGDVQEELYSDSFIARYAGDTFKRLCAKPGKTKTKGKPSKVARHNVYKRDGHKCLKCGTKEHLTLDHIVPTSKGGEHGEDNLQTLCAVCNLEKAARIVDYRGKFPDDFPEVPKSVDSFPNDFPYFPQLGKTAKDVVHLSV